VISTVKRELGNGSTVHGYKVQQEGFSSCGLPVVDSHKDIDTQNEIISEMEKLNIQKHDLIDDVSENSATVMNTNMTSIETEDGQEKIANITNTSLTRRDRVKSSQFEFLRVLGKGAFGTVSLVQKNCSADGRLYAMKVLAKASIIKKNAIQDSNRVPDIGGDGPPSFHYHPPIRFPD
jgi:hypothetical protein